MTIINFKIEGQVLTKTTDAVIPSGSAGVVKCAFEFDESWNDFIKTAVFYQDKRNEQYAIIESDGTCEVPPAAMNKKGIMCVGVFGIKGTDMPTSTVERVEILEGAVDSDDVDIEPSDDIFLAIVARYQAILEQLDETNQNYEEIIQKITEQNEILAGLDAFDVADIQSRLSEIEIEINEVKALGAEFQKNFRINDVTIAFDSNGSFVYEDVRITENTLCDVFFDALCVAAASAAIVSVESHDGYIQFQSTYTCNDKLTCDLYCVGV